MRQKEVNKNLNPNMPSELGLTNEQYDEMYKYLAIAKYEDRFVIPTASAQNEESDYFKLRAELGFEKKEEHNNLFGGR